MKNKKPLIITASAIIIIFVIYSFFNKKTSGLFYEGSSSGCSRYSSCLQHMRSKKIKDSKNLKYCKAQYDKENICN